VTIADDWIVARCDVHPWFRNYVGSGQSGDMAGAATLETTRFLLIASSWAAAHHQDKSVATRPYYLFR
jgi:hypothetical protein